MFLLLASIFSVLFYPPVSRILGIATLFLSLALSAYTIHEKHKGTEHSRAKILKDVGVMALTLIIIIFLGGIAALLANAQISGRWGEVAGLISAVAASFGVGYFVRKGMMRLVS
jgi:fructose-specific phosphotransferase system IIC component